MAILVGGNDLKNVTLPASIDGNQLEKFKLADGTTFDKLVTDFNDALTIAWNNVKADPLFKKLCFVTTELTVEYKVGTQSGFTRKVEYVEPDGQRSDTSGHMLPIEPFNRALEWTEGYLKKANVIKLDADITTVVSDLERLIWQKILERLTSKALLAGNALGLGTTGKSVPFADGGDCGVPFTPPDNSKRAFVGEATHDHYLRLNGKTQANVEAAVKHLYEHGHNGPFEMIVSELDIAEWTNKTNITGYKERPPQLVQQGANAETAQVDEAYIGVIVTPHGTVKIYPMGQLPTDYWNVYKSYGDNDPRNALYFRYDPAYGEGPVLKVALVRTLPIEGAIIEIHFGVGVGKDLTIAVNVLDASSGDYSDPTIAG